jgi:hypothetical protein
VLERRLDGTWETEFEVGATRVDVAGRLGSRRVLVELEWRRADPADNAAKLFRHLQEGRLDADRIDVCQLFTDYYRLARGGYSVKRENATFVGRVAADALDRLLYTPVDLRIDPPTRGSDLPDGWKSAADAAADTVVGTVRE